MQTSQEHFTTMADAKFDGEGGGGGGKKEGIMGNGKKENLLPSDDMDDAISHFFYNCFCKQSDRQCDKKKDVP